jgi:hypothetical protein
MEVIETTDDLVHEIAAREAIRDLSALLRLHMAQRS